MRVLIGMPDKSSLGGPIYCEPPFVEALRSAGVEVDEETYVYGDGGTSVSLWNRMRRVFGAASRLRRRTREKTYDFIHLNTSIDEKCVLRDLVTISFLRSSRIPIYLKMHGSIERFLMTRNVFWRYLQRRLFARAAGIGVLSNQERDNFVAAGCPMEKISLAKLVVEAGDFSSDPDFRTNHGIGADTPILLFSARFVPTKGLLDVLLACAELKKADRDFVLFCLGDGPIRAEAEKLTSDLSLIENVRFFGYIPEIETATFHANCTIFVFPTYHDEGFPLVLLKSAAAGLPIITTRIRGAADHFTDPENCLWVEPRDPPHLAATIIRLLDDGDLLDSMAENNRRLAKGFAAQRVAEEYLQIYQKMIKTP